MYRIQGNAGGWCWGLVCGWGAGHPSARQTSQPRNGGVQGAEVLGPYVDAQLGLLECLEALVAHLRRHGGPAAEPEATLMEARCEQVAAGLVALAK
jgi:hypothetical protein